MAGIGRRTAKQQTVVEFTERDDRHSERREPKKEKKKLVLMDNLTENSRVMSQQIRGVCNDNYLRANDQGQQTSKKNFKYVMPARTAISFFLASEIHLFLFEGN